MSDNSPLGENALDFAPLKTLLSAEATAPGGNNLIAVLQKTQDIYGYLPRGAIERVAEALSIKPAKVMGVATFYTQFRFSPAGKHVIQVCHGTACHVNGADSLSTALTESLGITEGQTTPDGLFTLQYVACLGCCSLSPVMTVNGVPYGNLTSETAQAVIAQLYQANQTNK
jgi:NADH-quinone oxidoreductase subunit E